MRNLISLIFLSGIVMIGKCEHWKYPKPQPNGIVTDQELWGGECDTGRQQSPVDLSIGAAVKGSFPPFIFNSGYTTEIPNAAVTNTGHSIQINNAPGNKVLISGGGLPATYMFDQMHFHWGSEHTINDMRYGGELHIVHHDDKYEKISEAVKVKNGIAVVGILFHVDVSSNPVIDSIIESAIQVKDQVGKSVDIKKDLFLNDLLPLNRSTYFRYEGSLTTPGCGEAVVWTVFTHSLPISMKQIDQLKSIIQTDDGETLTHNYRSVQPLNARTLVYISPSSHLADNAANLMTYSAGLAFIIYLMHLILH